MRLIGNIKKISEFSSKEIDDMYKLMFKFYDNIDKKNFLEDFWEKDYCIYLKDKNNKIKGFSTQKIMEFEIENNKIIGVFSGDTIIHKENWGDLSLFQTFAKFFFPYGEQYKNFYWFLIVKGYKTYKILPTFFKSFYPNFRESTPEETNKIKDSFGYLKFPDEYNRKTGVIEYKKIKDSLKKGVADITEKELGDKDVQYFLKLNPYYEIGNDLVCIAELKKENLKNKVLKILFG